MKKISDRDLRFKYPDERELGGWFESLDELTQQEYHFEFEALVPDWQMFLRRKRYEALKNHNNII